jgi:ABC-type transporter Mla subunit MlaD
MFTRIGRWFRKPLETNGNGGIETIHAEIPTDAAGAPLTEPRGMLLRPRRGRDDMAYGQTIANIQTGLNSLTGLMSAIQANLEAQNHRQEELLHHLATLPKVLESIPDSARQHGETLRAIHDQIANQGQQQEKLGEILTSMNKSGSEQAESLDGLKSQIESISMHDEAIADNLKNVGSAMQTVSQNSQTSAEVLQQLRQNLNGRDDELQRVLHRQGTRFTTMLSIAIFLSMSALASVVVMAWLILKK